MSENNKIPVLAPTDIVELRNGKCGIVLMNAQASLTGLSIFTHYPNSSRVKCLWHLDNYNDNICEKEHSSDIIKVWKSNIKTQTILINAFFDKLRVPCDEPDWKESPKKMTLKEIEAIIGYPITIVTKHEEEASEDE